MIDATLLVSWRTWHACNEVTHSKALPTIDGSRRFLEGYRQLVNQVKNHSMEEVLKGKQLVIITGRPHVERDSKSP
jgi:hypothetical protein